MTWFDGNSTDGTSDGFTPPEGVDACGLKKL
jgi:hypothetical protein